MHPTGCTPEDPDIDQAHQGNTVTSLFRPLAIAAAGIVFGASAWAQAATDIGRPAAVIPLASEAPAKLVVYPPLAEPLARGVVIVQYRTENLRIMPVYGNAALAVSPRLGHLHYYVDGQSWPTVDSSGETVVLVGLQPGPHKVRLELADATHKPIPGATQLVDFTVPQK